MANKNRKCLDDPNCKDADGGIGIGFCIFAIVLFVFFWWFWGVII